MNRSRFLPALVAGLVLVLAACSGATESTTLASVGAAASDEPSQAESEAAAPSEATGEAATVSLSEFQFDPTELTIAAGTEVSFMNADSAKHTVTEGTDGEAAEDPIIDEELSQNGSTSLTFDEPGTYEITCLFHPPMNLTVVVE